MALMSVFHRQLLTLVSLVLSKLRAKLGLKPLEVNAIKKEAGTKEEPVAADVINPMALRQREELREKLAAAKEKRLLNQKLGKIKTLGEDDPWLDDTAAWIERSRQLQKEKDLAEKRARLLEEMDQEFGVSTLVEEEFGQRRQDLYSARDLQGLTVEHAIDSFREGETVILTLKDKGVLQEGEDVLVNVNLVDKERAEKNVELRKKKPDYLPYAEDESVDDLAQAGLAARWGLCGFSGARLGPNPYVLSCSKNPALSCPSMMRSSRASGRTRSAWSRVAPLTACGSGSWRRSGPSCGCRLSP
uniref:U4/U6.U5 tri-snRNP-associated protein 1 n=1 Tax=Ailuropoda melanoleuca TaxID=9646 RepID=A0A7N5KRK3_AILME